jgi:hypothetical protein
MSYTKEEKLEIQGFRNGYFIANEAPSLQKLILNLEQHNPVYLLGFEKGIKQQEKDREQDEHER